MELMKFLCGLMLVPSLLALAELSPIALSASFSEELALGSAGAIWFSIPGRLFYASYLVKTYPNGTRNVGSGTAFAIDASSPTLNADGTLSVPNNSTSMHCVESSTASGLQSSLTWVPEIVGNWKLQVAVIFFYGSGSEPYRYPNSTTVCIDPPFKSEQTYIATFNVIVRSTGTSVTTINPATVPPLYPSGGSSTTTVALPSTLTGAPFSNWSARSSTATMLSILGTIAPVLLFTQFLL